MLICMKPEMLTPSRDFLRWTRRRLRNDLLPFLVFIICFVHLLRIYVHNEFYIWTIRKCHFQKTDWLINVDDESFFSIMWQAIPNIVSICSHGASSDRMYTFESEGQEVMFMESFPEIPVKRCNILFVTDNADLTIPTDIKHEYINCVVHVSSDKLYSTPSSSLIATYPYKIKPGDPLKEDLFADIAGNKDRNVSLITLLSFYVRRYRMTSIVINTKDAHKLVPMFFSDGSMEKSRLTTCQLNIAYPKPTTDEEIQDFRTAWERLIYDRHYLVLHASRTQDELNLFLINIVNPFCWQLYVALNLPTTETF